MKGERKHLDRNSSGKRPFGFNFHVHFNDWPCSANIYLTLYQSVFFMILTLQSRFATNKEVNRIRNVQVLPYGIVKLGIKHHQTHRHEVLAFVSRCVYSLALLNFMFAI